MSDRPPSKLSSAVAILGWAVAFSSLILNYVNYLDNQKTKERQLQQTATYAAEISTYNTRHLPQAILQVNQPIRQEFTIKHRSGKPVTDLVATFTTIEKEIVDIGLMEGKSGSSISLDPAKHEASVRKSELLPGQQLKGYITTQGIAQVSMATGAKDGEEIAVSRVEDSFGIDWYALLIMGVVAIGIAALAYYLLRRVDRTFLASHLESPRLLLLLLVLGVLLNVFRVFHLSDLFYALVIYFGITRFKLLDAVMVRLARKPRKAELERTPEEEG